MKNLIKLSLVVALVVACGSASAVFVDNPNTLALWHCDATNWSGAVELTPDDNSTGRTAHDMKVNETNELTLAAGSPYGGDSLVFDGISTGLGLDVLATHTDIMKVEFAFKPSELPPASGHGYFLLYPHALEALLKNGVVQIIAFDSAAQPTYLNSTKTINVDTWYTVSATASNGYVSVTVGNDSEGYETDSATMGAGLYEGFHDVLIGAHAFAPNDTGWYFRGNMDEIRISLPIPEPFTFGLIGLVGLFFIRKK